MNMNDLIDQLEQLVDSGSERVKSMFAELRASVPRPKTLAFDAHSLACVTTIGKYSYWTNETSDNWGWYCIHGNTMVAYGSESTEPDVIAAMQQHFNAAWSAMTTRRGLR